MRKASRLDVLVTEHSALKRKIAIETFRGNGYTKRPLKGYYTDEDNNWVMLKKGKVKIRLEWPVSDAFIEKKIARKKR